MIQLESVEKTYGGDTLFSELTWQIPQGETIGFVGPNGAGKTTLFRIVAGQQAPDTGRVVRPNDVRVGFLPQEMELSTEGTVLDVVLEGREDLLELRRQIDRLEQQMAEGDSDEQLAGRYAELEDRFRREGGYEMRSDAREIAAGVGFDSREMDRPIEEFSGGWKMRALLARLLFSRPDVLLLDEPTNHLDVDSIEWLEGYLSDYSSTAVIISHDRYFLNRLVDGIAELHAGRIATYSGDYDDYLQQRQQRRRQLIEQRERQQREIERIQQFIDKFRYNASRASQVQSRIKQLEKMELVEVPPSYESDIHFEFPDPPRVGKVVLEATDLSKRFGDRVVYDGVDFRLSRGDRVAFVGPNGAGKSTLLRMLAGRLAPDEGQVERGHRVEVSYFAQHSVDQLDLQRTVLEEMYETASTEAAGRVRSILGAFLFEGDDVEKPISVLSGGEKSRLALAKMLLEPAGCLLLDEPTNHLDIPSRRVLEHALAEFEGAFCIVSHDRYFLNEVVNRVVQIERGELTDYPGDYDDYHWKRQQLEQSSDSGTQPADSGEDNQQDRRRSAREIRRETAELRRQKARETRQLRQEVDELEGQIAELEQQLEEVQQTLADPQTHQGDGQRIQQLQKRHDEIETQLMEAMDSWEQKGSRLEAIENKYDEMVAEVRSGSR